MQNLDTVYLNLVYLGTFMFVSELEYKISQFVRTFPRIQRSSSCYIPTNEHRINDNDGSRMVFILHVLWCDELVIGVLDIRLE